MPTCPLLFYMCQKNRKKGAAIFKSKTFAIMIVITLSLTVCVSKGYSKGQPLYYLEHEPGVTGVML